MKQPFAVKSNTFSLLGAFKDEVEKIGWNKVPVNDNGMKLLEFNDYKFCEERQTNYQTFTLPTQWDEAIGAAKEWFEEEKPKENIWVRAKSEDDIKNATLARIATNFGDCITTLTCNIIPTGYGLIAIYSFPVTDYSQWEVIK